MLIAGKFIFSLFIGVLIGILIEKTANHLAVEEAQQEQKSNYYYDSNDDFFYSDEYINMEHVKEN